jgi:Glycosyl hydrolase family 20, catalytic domain/Glycosyl hydrolase family 20, domain 2
MRLLKFIELRNMPVVRQGFIFLSLILLAATASNAKTGMEGILPDFKSNKLGQTLFELSSSLQFIEGSQVEKRFWCGTVFQPKLFKKFGARYGSIKRVIFLSPTSPNIASHNSDYEKAITNKEGFAIIIQPEEIQVVSKTKSGYFLALSTIEDILIQSNGKMRNGIILDWPTHKIRALHFDINGVNNLSAYRLIDWARQARYNTLILQTSDRIKLPGLEKLSRQHSWSVERYQNLIKYAKMNNLTVIPEVKLLTHQEKFLKSAYPQYMYNKVTYNPGNRDLYKKVVFPYLDELIRLIKPKAILIGHDEVINWKKFLNANDKVLPAKLFLEDVETVYNYLEKKGVKTWMWGDMLLSSKEFPKMLKRHLHAFGDYPQLLSKLPKNIVICDWHYFDIGPTYRSSIVFEKAGHKVLGATWKTWAATSNFSRFLANHPKNSLGMIATLWSYVQKREWPLVEKIVFYSGKVFWNPYA